MVRREVIRDRRLRGVWQILMLSLLVWCVGELHLADRDPFKATSKSPRVRATRARQDSGRQKKLRGPSSQGRARHNDQTRQWYKWYVQVVVILIVPRLSPLSQLSTASCCVMGGCSRNDSVENSGVRKRNQLQATTIKNIVLKI